MNVYITNTSLEEVPTNYVHSLYSLRWQIEILFKTRKSFFEIDECKNIKFKIKKEQNIEKYQKLITQIRENFKINCGRYRAKGI